MPKTIAQGAEAIITLVTPRSEKNSSLTTSQSIASHSEPFIIKDRIPKSYRLPQLDESIRKHRTKSETKLLEKASEIINSPIPQPQKDKFKIKMPFIEGKKLSEHLDSFSLTKQKQICKQIGESVAKLHDANIIHGDLTTSNMILTPPQTSLKKSSTLSKSQAKKSGKANFEVINPSEASVYFIDFGLGFQSHKYEDKAVDLHLLRQALEAKHFKHWEELFNNVIEGYKKFPNYKIILERLKAVEKRGRYKH